MTAGPAFELGPAWSASGRFAAELTVIVPAYNEAGSLADTVKSLRYLRSTVAIASFDAAFAPAATLVLLPLLVVFASPWYALGFVIDIPVVAIPVLAGAWRRAELRRALASLPCYFLLRLANCWFMLRSLADEARGRRLATYEKGH